MLETLNPPLHVPPLIFNKLQHTHIARQLGFYSWVFNEDISPYDRDISIYNILYESE